MTTALPVRSTAKRDTGATVTATMLERMLVGAIAKFASAVVAGAATVLIPATVYAPSANQSDADETEAMNQASQERAAENGGVDPQQSPEPAAASGGAMKGGGGTYTLIGALNASNGTGGSVLNPGTSLNTGFGVYTDAEGTPRLGDETRMGEGAEAAGAALSAWVTYIGVYTSCMDSLGF